VNVTAISQAARAIQPERARAIKAGAEFEAVLLNSVFGGLERAFSHLPGEQESATSKSYDGMAIEALTSGLAKSGGIGLGSLISSRLMEQKRGLKDF